MRSLRTAAALAVAAVLLLCSAQAPSTPSAARAVAVGASSAGTAHASAAADYPASWEQGMKRHGAWIYQQEARRAAYRARLAREAEARRRAAEAARQAQERAPSPDIQGGYGGSGGCASGYVHDLIVRAFGGQASHALYIARRESNCDPSAKNRNSSASGVFQIVAGTWAYWSVRCGYGGSSVFSATANVSVAACMVRNGGWGPWQ